jgi:5-methylcytosine-specific restriction endonuclease McrA
MIVESKNVENMHQSPAFAKPMLSAAAVKLSKAKIRSIVFDKCKGKCAYCGTDLVKGWNIDHIKPKIFGGTNDLENLNPSCKDCNNYKCHTDLEGYRNQLHKILNEKLITDLGFAMCGISSTTAQ